VIFAVLTAVLLPIKCFLGYDNVFLGGRVVADVSIDRGFVILKSRGVTRPKTKLHVPEC
jgi:hypothetical protein